MSDNIGSISSAGGISPQSYEQMIQTMMTNGQASSITNAAGSDQTGSTDGVALSSEAGKLTNVNSTSSGSTVPSLATGDTTTQLLALFMNSYNQMMSAGSSSGSLSGSGTTGGAGGVSPGGDMPQTGSPANNVAQYMAGFKYEFYYNDKKSVASTISSKGGNCKDLADVAMQKFKEQGIKTQLILGDVKLSDYSGGHYWIKYQDPSTGQWKFFDPTAAASNHSAERAFKGCHGTYSTGKVVSTM